MEESLGMVGCAWCKEVVLRRKWNGVGCGLWKDGRGLELSIFKKSNYVRGLERVR